MLEYSLSAQKQVGRILTQAQGPKESSRSHFWHMLWYETATPAVIVMLTQTHETGREKCFAYYPQDMENKNLPVDTDPDDEKAFKGTIELLELKDDELTRCTIRKLIMKVGEEEKVVWHYLFTGWPDFLVPEGQDRSALLQLIRHTATTAEDPTNSRIVHCSAGVGRSGTFIALDYLLSELAEGALDDMDVERDRIAEVVSELRKQRMMMVQGEAQFDFLYEIMKEQWLEKHGLTPDAEVHSRALVSEESLGGSGNENGLKS